MTLGKLPLLPGLSFFICSGTRIVPKSCYEDQSRNLGQALGRSVAREVFPLCRSLPRPAKACSEEQVGAWYLLRKMTHPQSSPPLIAAQPLGLIALMKMSTRCASLSPLGGEHLATSSSLPGPPRRLPFCGSALMFPCSEEVNLACKNSGTTASELCGLRQFLNPFEPQLSSSGEWGDRHCRLL